MSEELKHKIYSATECLSEQTMFDYIDHKLSAKERHLVEKHMLDCEMCSDAMEGLEIVKDRNRISVINKIVDEFITPIAEKETKIISINYKTVFSIAAGIALLIGGVFFFKNFTSQQMKSSDVAEVLPLKDQTPPPPPPSKEKGTEDAPASPVEEAPAVTANGASAITETDAPAITNEREKGPQAKSLNLKSKEGQLESTEDLKQNIALAEGKEKDKKEPFKTAVVTGAATKAPASSGKTYAWSANDNAANGAKSDDAVAKQKDDRKKVTPTPASPESTINAPMGGAGESNKNQLADESKKAEEKVVAHNNNITATPSYGYATTQTAKPDQNQEQKNDKSNSNGDQIALAKKSEKSGKYRAESETKGKDKLAANKTDEDVAGTVAYEPKSVGTLSDKEQVQTESKTAPATTVITTDNTTVDGLFYKEAADSVNTIIEADQFNMPEYPGGDVAAKKFIQENFKYSKLSGEEGTKIVVQFTVDKDGSIKNPKVIKGINPVLNNEALRVVKLMPKFIPAKNREKAGPILFNLPIQLKIK